MSFVDNQIVFEIQTVQCQCPMSLEVKQSKDAIMLIIQKSLDLQFYLFGVLLTTATNITIKLLDH